MLAFKIVFGLVFLVSLIGFLLTFPAVRRKLGRGPTLPQPPKRPVWPPLALRMMFLVPLVISAAGLVIETGVVQLVPHSKEAVEYLEETYGEGQPYSLFRVLSPEEVGASKDDIVYEFRYGEEEEGFLIITETADGLQIIERE